MASLLMSRPRLDDLPAPGRAVRDATAADANRLAVLLDRSFDEVWDAGRVHRELLDDVTVVRTIVIEDGEHLIATASTRLLPERYPSRGYLHWVASDPERRGERLGLAVVAAVLLDMAERDLTGCVLETDDDRLSALRLYLGLGFVPVLRDDDHAARWSRIMPQLFGRASSAGAAS